MEQSNPREGGHFGGCCFSSAFRHHLLRTLFWVLIVLGFVFAVAAGVETSRYAMNRKVALKYAQAGYPIMSQGDSYRVLPKLIMSRIENKHEEEVKRVFGNITKVEGNKITITDNGTANQLIMSDADTQIYVSSTEVGIAALKVGQNAVFSGIVQDGQLEVKLIEIK